MRNHTRKKTLRQNERRKKSKQDAPQQPDPTDVPDQPDIVGQGIPESYRLDLHPDDFSLIENSYDIVTGVNELVGAGLINVSAKQVDPDMKLNHIDRILDYLQEP